MAPLFLLLGKKKKFQNLIEFTVGKTFSSSQSQMLLSFAKVGKVNHILQLKRDQDQESKQYKTWESCLCLCIQCTQVDTTTMKPCQHVFAHLTSQTNNKVQIRLERVSKSKDSKKLFAHEQRTLQSSIKEMVSEWGRREEIRNYGQMTNIH